MANKRVSASSISRVLSGEKFRSYVYTNRMRSFGGHECIQGRGEHHAVYVSHRFGMEADHLTDEQRAEDKIIWLNEYRCALLANGYLVKILGSRLHVSKP